MKERRKEKRLSLKCLAHVYFDEKILCSTVINISKKGIGILIPKNIPPGEKLRICIEYKREKDRKIEINAEAEIVWIMEDKKSGMFRAGVEISYISEEDFMKLKENVNFHSKY